MAPGNRVQLQDELQRLIMQYGVTDVREVFAELASTPGEHTQCSFCGRGPHEIKSLFAGSGVFICSSCVDLLHKMKQETLET